MSKKIKLAFNCLLLIFILAAMCACDKQEDEDPYEGFAFAKRGSEYAITGYQGKTIVNIPDTYMDLPVTVIAESAFFRSQTRKIYLGQNIKTIADNAFALSPDLTYLFISKNVTAIGDNILNGCHALYEIEVDEQNPRYQTIDGDLYTKDGSSLLAYSTGKGQEQVTIASTVQNLGSYLFYDNPYIKELTLPDSLTEIGEMAFYGSSIENYYINENEKFSVSDGILYKENSTLYAFPPARELDEYQIPDGVTAIFDDAFTHSDIKRVVLPEGVTDIGKRAFLSSQIMDIHIPSSVNKIGERALQQCQSLINITVSNQNSNFQDIAGQALLSADGKRMIAYALGQTNSFYSLPNGVEEVVDAVFLSPPNLQEIILPSSLKKLGEASINGANISAIIFNSDTPPQMEYNSISSPSFVIYVPNGLEELYKNYNEVWESFNDTIMEISQR